MRALRFVEARRLELAETPAPEPGPGEVLVRVAACGICGSDLSCYKTGVFAGSVLGHEFAGWVEGAGNAVTGWSAGDAVAVDPKIPCGTCADCRSGAAHRCVSSLTLGIGSARPGAFAELVTVPAASLHRLPASVSPEDACLAEPLSCAVHGIERAAPRAGEAALVIGLGPIGLLAVAALRARGVTSILGIDPVEARRTLALALGAERSFPPGEDARTAAAGVSLAVECSGRPEMLQEAANLTAPGGRVVLLGVAMSEATVVPMVWVTREITILGSVASSPQDFRRAISMLGSDPGLARIITRRVGLAEAPRAFEDLLSPASDAKVAVDPRR